MFKIDLSELSHFNMHFVVYFNIKFFEVRWDSKCTDFRQSPGYLFLPKSKQKTNPKALTVIFVPQDPGGETAAEWESTGSLGIFLQEFALPQKCPLGQWKITTAVNVGLKLKRALL